MISFLIFSTLFIFALQNQQCTHVSGNYLVGLRANYGTTGQYSSETTPGGIHSPRTFLVKGQNETEIYLFFGYSTNNVWKFSLEKKQWAFVKGGYGSYSYFTETNIFSSSSLIGARYYFDGWKQNKIVYFFGGFARFRAEDRSGTWTTAYLRSNELWKYNITSNLYSVLHYNYMHTDSGSYYLGTTNTNCFAVDKSFGEFHPDNIPGARDQPLTVAISDTQVVLLGGSGFNRVLGKSTNYLDDTWIFDSILLQWKHVGGDLNSTFVDQSGYKHSITLGTTNVYSPENNYGKRRGLKGVLMNNEEILFFGGIGHTTGSVTNINLVQKYNVTSNMFKYLAGLKIYTSSPSSKGFFREYMDESIDNYPGGRRDSEIFKINDEEIVMVGGYGNGKTGNGNLNDEWWFNTKHNSWRFSGKEVTMYANRFQISNGDTKTSDLIFGGIQQFSGQYLKDSNELLIFMGFGYDKFTQGVFNDVWSIYYGNECNILKDTDPEVCLGRGKCIGFNTCQCNDGFYGTNCELSKCNGIFSNETETVCSGKGICVDSKCACYFSSSYNLPDCTLDVEQQKIDQERQEMLENLWIYFTIPIAAIVVLVVVTALSILLLFIGCKLCKILRKFEGIEDIDLILNEAKIEQSNVNPKINVDSSLFEVNIKDIKLIKIIGEGGSQTSVFLAEWKGNPCAYKSFKIGDVCNTVTSYEEFEREVKLYSSINHPSILQFYGACINPPNVGILLQFCSFGDISSYYSKCKYVKKKEIPFAEKLRILKEIALGMQYLHSINVIHRDLKPENVLIDDNKNSKIMDFGLSKLVSNEEKTMTKQIGTSFYMAPEVFKAGDNYSEKCDVYSYAILALVLISENFFPYGVEANQSMILRKVSKNPNFRPKIVEKDFEECGFLKDLIQKNWDSDPKKRNAFEEIVVVLKSHEKKNKT